MKRSSERILTSHAGSLPRPPDLLALANAEPRDEKRYGECLTMAVKDIVDRQIKHGIDVIDDGEYGKPDFVGYINERLSGFTPGGSGGPGFAMRDVAHFPEFYEEFRREHASMAPLLGKMYPPLICTGPIKYVGHAVLQRDIANLKAALKGREPSDVFMPAISPENAEQAKANEYYKTDEEYSIALAEALNEEYRTIVDAGFLVQIDDPQLITYYNRHPDKTVAECRKWAQGRIEILNHALRGISEEKIRFHTCYSFDTFPRVGDMELKDMLDLILKIKAGAYSFEGANPRHEHEYELWETTKLPDGKILMPGVVAISSMVVEHPDLVAQRLIRYAKLIGCENVIACSDCGFGTVAVAVHAEVHPTVAWAKIDALVEGSRKASKVLWRQ
jgi:5-methyltetrahydropteroyltriglutamate--homocysteine methyltransferase